MAVRNFVLICVSICVLLIGCGDPPNSRNAIMMESSPDERVSAENNYEFDLQRLIKSANLRFQTSDIEGTYKLVKNSLKDFSAFISNESNFNYETQTGYDLTIKVPADKFENLLNFIIENANIRKLENKSVQVRDVTEEFIDIQARLKIKKEAQQKLSELLKQTKNVIEILEVHKQMTDLLAEIESIEGRLKYITDQTTYSIINLSFFENAKYSYRFFSEFWYALKEGWQVFLHLITWLAYLWVILLGALLIIGGVKIYSRRKRRKNKSDSV
jgi:hypothetical protein